MAPLLAQRYFWHGLARDCVVLCAWLLPVQLERRDFCPGPALLPLLKSLMPLLVWAIDLVMHLKDGGRWEILVVAVCVFSKWVEAAPLPDRRSTTIARWFHSESVCRYGAPALVRCDHGTEFRGAFAKYLGLMGIKQSLILPQHPRANGLVERYNGIIVSGLRRMKAAVPDASWDEVLPEVLAGLRQLPRRLGFQPHLMVFKQYPNVLGSLADGLPLGADGADV